MGFKNRDRNSVGQEEQELARWSESDVISGSEKEDGEIVEAVRALWVVTPLVLTRDATDLPPPFRGCRG